MTDGTSGRDEMDDPLDDIEGPTLAEQLEPYRKYDNPELAVSLLSYEKFGGPGLPSAPAKGATADYHCPDCEENVRGVSRRDGHVVACPLCGCEPGMLTLGKGPQ